MLSLNTQAIETALILLSPFAPHMADELWSSLGHEKPLLEVPWPTFREEALRKDQITLVIQVNGKPRAHINVAADADRAALEAQALAHERIGELIAGKDVKKVRKQLGIPNRLV